MPVQDADMEAQENEMESEVEAEADVVESDVAAEETVVETQENAEVHVVETEETLVETEVAEEDAEGSMRVRGPSQRITLMKLKKPWTDSHGRGTTSANPFPLE